MIIRGRRLFQIFLTGGRALNIFYHTIKSKFKSVDGPARLLHCSQIDWCYLLRTRNKNISDVLNQELQAIKEKVKYMNITIEKTVKKTGAFLPTQL